MLEEILLSLIYFGVLIWLGWKGYRATTKGSDYMIAGREMNPFVMGMSYGATSISTAGIIGYGGAAGQFGLSLMWGTVLYVGVGVFVAMVFFGPRTRRLGLALNAQTFPELLGRRCQSNFVQGFAGSIIFLFIPIYAAAVLIGIARLLQVSLDIPYEVGLVAMTAIVATLRDRGRSESGDVHRCLPGQCHALCHGDHDGLRLSEGGSWPPTRRSPIWRTSYLRAFGDRVLSAGPTSRTSSRRSVLRSTRCSSMGSAWASWRSRSSSSVT